jgi:BCD family chlorophyll transporter-like MFS transporter
MFLGGALRDAITGITTQGLWGPAMADPSVAYSMVYHVEMLLLFITLIAIGPMVSRQPVVSPTVSPLVPPTLGLTESHA